jgi:YHS domain-containing protein
MAGVSHARGRRGIVRRESGTQGRAKSREEMATAIDPVCGMEVDTDAAAASWEYRGTTYYFCARGCLHDFQEDPDSYLR